MAFFEKRRKGSDNNEASPLSSPNESPWMRAQMMHENTYLRLAAQVANWRMFAFFMIVIAAVAVAGNIYIGSKSKFIPFLIEVDKLGRTVAVRALTGDDAVTDPQRLAYREMFDLFVYLRTVTTDSSANRSNLHKGFSRLTGAAKNYAREELLKAPPNEVGATKTVQVVVKSALPISEKTWQVEWEEHSFSLQGEEIGIERWKATLHYDMKPSDDVQIMRENPSGFVVSELNWTKVI